MMTNDDIAAGLAKVLSAHGHGFQYAVLNQCVALQQQRLSRWHFDASEYPVELRGITTHVDFVLRMNGAYLIAECKRADPAAALWCFVRASVPGRNHPIVSLLCNNGGQWQEWPCTASEYSEKPFHVAHELREHGAKGDGIGGSQKAISGAVEQVMRGLGGFAEEVKNSAFTGLYVGEPVALLPVVFTTARLFTSAVDLADTSVDTGAVPTGALTEQPWVWYQVNLSRALRPAIQPSYRVDDQTVPGTLLRRHTRAIAIVSTSGIPAFLGQSAEWSFDRI